MPQEDNSTASSHILWVIYLPGQYTIEKGSSGTTLSHISWALYWLEIESNKKHLLTALSYIFWVIKHSGTILL